ncbi:MAG TPA: septal ring lytic transglycosylase RlpA family protein [Candidatus Acidoferrum sp.]|nr:septal ring lytic transglycosylase RlpA family protein [Candidatus Acidoferrum sp.]
MTSSSRESLSRVCSTPSAPGPSNLGTLAIVLVAVALVVAGCAHRSVAVQPPATAPQPAAPPGSSGQPPVRPSAPATQPPIAGAFVEDGVASWYGPGFDGHHTSNGEIYDMHQFTAAHRTLPFNSVIRVTNLTNGKQTEVRINDRGPFVSNRVIDLSYAAAQAIGMVGPGTAEVRLELVSATNLSAGFFGVQVGAFLRPENAERLKGQLEARYSPVNVVTFDSPTGVFYRVRVGRFDTESEARQLATQLHDMDRFTTFVVRLDE